MYQRNMDNHIACSTSRPDRLGREVMSSPKTFGKIFAVLLFCILSLSISAQVATLDSKKIFASMPILLKLDTMVATEQGRYQKEYQERSMAFQAQYKVADSLYKLRPKDAATLALVEKVQKMDTELKQYEQEANKKLTEYKSILYQPYYDKVNAAIKAVALRLKYSQVMDTQQVSFAYVDSAKDITEEVIKQLK